MIPVETFQKDRRDAQALVNGVRGVLDQLSRGTSRIDIDQEIAVERILLSIRPDDRPIHSRLAELLALIGPVVCKNPEQQARFQILATRQTRAQQEISSHPVSPPTMPGRRRASVKREKPAPVPRYDGDPDTDHAIRIHAKKKNRLSLVLIITLSILFGIGLTLIAMVSTPVPTPPDQGKVTQATGVAAPGPTDTGRWHLLRLLLDRGFTIAHFKGSFGRWLLTLFPLLVVGFTIMRRQRLHRYIERRMTGMQPAAEDTIRIMGTPAALFGGGTRRRLLALRARLEQPTSNLDIPATLRATMASGGRYVLKYATRSLSSEYLVISRKLTDRAHLYHIGAALTDVMRKEEINVRHYAFWREGVRLVEVRDVGGDGAPDRNIQDLASLGARFPDHRLILVDEARHLIGRRGGISPWAEQLRAWPDKIWVTPVDRSFWGAGEAAAQDLGFELVALSDPDPLAALGKAFGGAANLFKPERSSSQPGDYPQSLYRRSSEFNSLEPPDKELLDTLMGELKSYLGPEGFRWLQACAVFPVLEPPLTCHLGKRLQSDDRTPLFSLQRFTALCRLPWFKTGEMPDWLREALIGEMPDHWRQTVRDRVIQILNPTATAGESASIEVVRRYRRRLIDAIAEKMRAQSPADRIRARLLIDFLYQKRTLSFGLPRWLFRGWREVLTPDAMVMGGLGLLAALFIYAIYEPFIHGVSGWMGSLFHSLGVPMVRAIVYGNELLAFSLLAWWAWDVVKELDARRNRRPLVMVGCAMQLLGTLFTIFLCLLYLGHPKQPFVTPSVAVALLFPLVLFGLSAAYLRAAVTPCLPKRIAVVPLYEAINRIPFYRLLGYVGRSLALGTVVLMALLAVTPPTGSDALYAVDYPYLIAISLNNRTMHFLRPLLAMPVFALVLGVTLKPALGRWAAVGNMVFAAFLGAAAAELLMNLASIAGLSFSARGHFWLPMVLVSLGGSAATALALFRYQVIRLRPVLWFIIAGELLVFGTYLLSAHFSFPTDVEGRVIALSWLFMPVLLPLACYFALRKSGTRIPGLRSLGAGLLSVLISIILLIFFLLISFAIDANLNWNQFSWAYSTFTIGCLCWASPLFWLRLSRPSQATAPSSWQRAGSAVPWLLVPCLLIISFGVRLTDSVTVDFSGLFLPLAVLLGLRYGKTGFIAFAVGACPLLVGFYLGPIFSWNQAALYLVCLACCRGFGDPEWLNLQIERFKARQGLVLLALLGLPAGFFFSNDMFKVGFDGFALALLAAFLCGLLRKDAYRFIAVASAVAAAVKIANLVGWPNHLRHNSFTMGYYLNSVSDILSLWVSAWLGRYLSKVAAPFYHAAPPEKKASPLLDSRLSPPGSRLRAVLKTVAGNPPAALPRIWPGLAYLGVLLLAYHRIEFKAVLARTNYDAIGVAVLVAHMASILAGAVSGRRSLVVIGLTAAAVMGIEPSLLSPPEFFLVATKTFKISFRVIPLHYATEFLSCIGCAWLGIYLRKISTSAGAAAIKAA